MIHYERNNIKKNLYHLNYQNFNLKSFVPPKTKPFPNWYLLQWQCETSHMPSFGTSITKQHSGSPYKLSTQHTTKPNMNNYRWYVNLAIHIEKMIWCTITHMILPCLTISAFQQQHTSFATNVPQGKYFNDTPIGSNTCTCWHLMHDQKISWAPLLLLHIFSLPLPITTINTLELCALNAEFRTEIFLISLLCRYHCKMDRGWKQAQK